ncbi:lactate utilization protein C [Chloroflexota bacterium]
MSSREQILNQLRQAPQPFGDVAPITERRHMVPLVDTSPEALRTLFVENAEKLLCVVEQPQNAEEAIEKILTIIGGDKNVTAWDFEHIPLPGLPETLAQNAITVAEADNPEIKVGITGAATALAATGSLVVINRPGQSSYSSLLPEVHIAVITADQITTDLEDWMVEQRQQGLDKFRQSSNTTIISGPSRTGDIAMEIVMGAHGPAELHIILLPS